MKMYATWGDPQPWAQTVHSWVRARGIPHEVQGIGVDEVVRVRTTRRPNLTDTA
jgi:hypothetical protein